MTTGKFSKQSLPQSLRCTMASPQMPLHIPSVECLTQLILPMLVKFYAKVTTQQVLPALASVSNGKKSQEHALYTIKYHFIVQVNGLHRTQLKPLVCATVKSHFKMWVRLYNILSCTKLYQVPRQLFSMRQFTLTTMETVNSRKLL